jgi:hypothetical protein
MNVKTNNYYGTYIRVLQKLVKNQRLLWKLYAGIATNEECQRLFVPYMRVLQGMQNASGYYGTHMRVLQGM